MNNEKEYSWSILGDGRGEGNRSNIHPFKKCQHSRFRPASAAAAGEGLKGATRKTMTHAGIVLLCMDMTKKEKKKEKERFVYEDVPGARRSNVGGSQLWSSSSSLVASSTVVPSIVVDMRGERGAKPM